MPATRAHSPLDSSASYQPGLDGLRAIAVAAVLLFHAGMKWLPGGFLGVDVFFVISGYLITGILVRNPSVRFGDFCLRRIRRLYPALLAMLLVTTTCAALLMWDAVATTVRDLPWALAFASNWWFIIHHVPYFEAMGRPPLFRHTWSLAVEFQFYLVWPLLVRVVFPRYGRAGVRYLALTLAAASVFLLTIDSATAANASRAYFGTDTHSMGIFLGAALATFPKGFAERFSKLRIFPDALGLAVLAFLFSLFHFVDESITHYRYGLPLASVCSVVLIAIATQPEGFLSRALASAPLRWAGTRSYSIYVWHWPIFQATRPGIDATPHAGVNFLLRLALTAALAELSWRFIEMPLRTGVLRHFKPPALNWNPKLFRLAVAGVAAVVLALGVAEVRLIRSVLRKGTTHVSVVPLPPQPPVPASEPASAPVTQSTLAITKAPAMLLGDSVLLGVSQWLGQKVNIVRIDATVGRQAKELRQRAELLAGEGDMPPVVIINLGNNGTVEEKTFRDILDFLKPCRRVIVVNSRVPRTWQDANDELIAKVIPDYANSILADWRTASDGHPEYFGPDGVHANVAGAKAYTELVVSALMRAPLPSALEKMVPVAAAAPLPAPVPTVFHATSARPRSGHASKASGRKRRRA